MTLASAFRNDRSRVRGLLAAEAADNTDVLLWIAIGTLAALGLSALLSLALGATLGIIGRDLGELMEADLWSVAPPARARARRA